MAAIPLVMTHVLPEHIKINHLARASINSPQHIRVIALRRHVCPPKVEGYATLRDRTTVLATPH
jgi:hypothetical protein